MTLKLFTSICAFSLIGLGATPCFAEREDFLTIEPDIICRTQTNPRDSLCPKLEHLRLRLGFDWSDALSFRLAYDAQHQTKVTWYNSYGLNVQRLPSRSSWLDDYGARLRLSSSWELGIEDWTAATLIPDASGLGFSRLLQDSGWNQSALRLTWINPDFRILAASLIVGQGEGERLEESDSTPYYGALTRLDLGQALSLQLAWSYDADSLDADHLFWVDRLEAKEGARGFTTSRQAASLFLDGTHPSMRGLRLSLGWANNHVRGPEPKSINLQADQSEGPFEPTELLAETLGGRSGLDRRTWLVSASYEILSSFVLAFHHQNLRVDLGDQNLLRSCEGLDLQGRCTQPATPHNLLGIRATTFGLGRKSESGWSIMLESMRESYDKLYELYHFAPGNDKRQRSLQILQLRISGKL